MPPEFAATQDPFGGGGGAGVQLPVSTFHTVDHNDILSVRFPF